MTFSAIQEYDATTANNNSDIGGNNIAENNLPSTINNALRELCLQLRKAVANQGSDIASAGTTDIGAATGQYVRVTGTTTITALGTVNAGTMRWVEFTGILTLTHNGTTLILPTGANITTAAGDLACFVSKGSGNWKCVHYQRADGSALVVTSASIPSDAVTYAKMQNVSAASRLLGRGSAAGAGDPEEITLGTGIAMSTTTLSATGKVAQVVRTSLATYTTCGTILPYDNTIPQITEGDEIFNVAITPTNASSILRVRVHVPVVGSGAAQSVSGALFVDATANALAVTTCYVPGGSNCVNMSLEYTVSAASTSARTYRFRVGAATATDAFVNGDGSARAFGGVAAATIEIEELLP